MNRKLITIILVVVTVVSVITAVMSMVNHRSYVKQQSLYEQQIQDNFNKRIRASEQALERSEYERDSLAVSATNLASDYEALLRVDKQKTDELTKIKGKFQDLTTKQLQDKMIEVYNTANGQPQ